MEDPGLPALIITAIITTILVIGIKESARFNATMVVVKLAVVLFVSVLPVMWINIRRMQRNAA